MPVDKNKITFYIDKHLKERCYNAVYWRSGPPDFLTVSKVICRGLELALEELEKKHNHRRPFKKRTGNVRSGRPVEY